jgi:mannose-1-phosphate guanylyltransferase
MKRIIVACLVVFGLTTGVWAAKRSGGYGYGTYGTGSNSESTYVKPYDRSDGTHVEGHYRTKPNNTESDNYGTKGNYNPNNGTFGTKSWNDNN